MKNIAVIAHVDSGKTTLCERLLYFSYTISACGEIEEGVTALDFLEEERTRGITIESSCISLNWKQERLGLLDTPGHLDFEVEVDLSLSAAESSLILISAVDGIESQTLNVWKKAKEKKLPSICFINKLDRLHLNLNDLVISLEDVLEVKALILSRPLYREGQLKGIIDVLNQKALYYNAKNPREIIIREVPSSMQEDLKYDFQRLIDIASLYCESLTQLFLNEEAIPIEDILNGLKLAVQSQEYMPIYMGSAYRNIGVRQLLNGLIWFTPEYLEKGSEIGFVFKVQVLEAQELENEKKYWVKLNQDFSLPYHNFSELSEIKAQEFLPIQTAKAGSIVAVTCNDDRRLTLGSVLTTEGIKESKQILKTEPLLEAVLELKKEEKLSLLEDGIQTLLKAYPSIKVRLNKSNGQWIVSTLGELQLQVFYKRLCKLTQAVVLRKIKPIYYEKYQLSESYIGKNKGSLKEQSLELEYEIYPSCSRQLKSKVDLEEDLLKVAQSAFLSFVKKPVLGYGELIGFSVLLLNINHNQENISSVLLHKVLYDALNLYFIPSLLRKQEPFVRLCVFTPVQYCGNVVQHLEKEKSLIKSLQNMDLMIKIEAEITLKATLGYTTTIRSMTKGLGYFSLEYLCYR